MRRREGGREGGKELGREVSSGEFDAPFPYLDEAETNKLFHEVGMLRAVEGGGRNGGHTL